MDTDLHPGLCGGWRWDQGQLLRTPELSVLRAGSTLGHVTARSLPVPSPEEAGQWRGLPRDGMETANHQKPAGLTHCPLETEPGAETELTSEAARGRLRSERTLHSPSLTVTSHHSWVLRKVSPGQFTNMLLPGIALGTAGMISKDVTGYAVTGTTRRERRGKGVPGKGPRPLQLSACSAAKWGHTCPLPLGDNGSYACGGSEDQTRGPTDLLLLSIQA